MTKMPVSLLTPNRTSCRHSLHRFRRIGTLLHGSHLAGDLQINVLDGELVLFFFLIQAPIPPFHFALVMPPTHLIYVIRRQGEIMLLDELDGAVLAD